MITKANVKSLAPAVNLIFSIFFTSIACSFFECCKFVLWQCMWCMVRCLRKCTDHEPMNFPPFNTSYTKISASSVFKLQSVHTSIFYQINFDCYQTKVKKRINRSACSVEHTAIIYST